MSLTHVSGAITSVQAFTMWTADFWADFHGDINSSMADFEQCSIDRAINEWQTIVGLPPVSRPKDSIRTFVVQLLIPQNILLFR